MRNLARPVQPNAFTEWKAANPLASNAGPPYLGFNELGQDAKAEAQATLCKNQHHLCAYCESRIEPAGSRMKIEHWLDQHKHPDQRFAWSNIFGVCWGGQNPSRGDSSKPVAAYCERARGDKVLKLNAYSFQGDLAAQFKFDRDGKVTGLTQHAQADAATLKLNHGRLKDNRKVVYEKLQKRLKSNGFSTNQLAAEIQIWANPGADGKLREYVSCALHHLDRWIRSQRGQASS